MLKVFSSLVFTLVLGLNLAFSAQSEQSIFDMVQSPNKSPKSLPEQTKEQSFINDTKAGIKASQESINQSQNDNTFTNDLTQNQDNINTTQSQNDNTFTNDLTQNQDNINTTQSQNTQNNADIKKLENSANTKELQNNADIKKLENSANAKELQNNANTTQNQASPNAPLQIKPQDISNIALTDEPDPTPEELYQYAPPAELSVELSLNDAPIYVYSPFYIDVIATSQDKTQLSPSLFVKSMAMKLINPKVRFNELKRGIYSARLWFEPISPSASIDEIAVIMKRGGELVQRGGAKPALPEIMPLESRDDFCNVVADELVVKNVKSSKFDEFNNLVLIELEAKNANLGEFTLAQKYEKQGIENIKGGVEAMSANYFVITKQDVLSINFSYFNALNKNYEVFSLPIEISGDDLSTQTNLNPQTSEFATYKSMAIYAIIVICLFSFMLWRSFYGIVLAVILGAYALYDARPFSQITVRQNAEISILPTRNSSVFHVLKTQQSLKVLDKYKNYTKVLLDDGKIGWIRNENIK